MNNPVYVEVPFEGQWSANTGWWESYPLDDSGACGRSVLWPCANEASALRFAEILAGNLDASPARARFASPDAAAADGRLDVGCDVRLCRGCGQRPARHHRTICATCEKEATLARKDKAAAAARAAALRERLTARLFA